MGVKVNRSPKWKKDGQGTTIPIESGDVAIESGRFGVKDKEIIMGYTTKPTVNQLDDYRLRVDAAKLCVERYTEIAPATQDFKIIGEFGSSVTTDTLYSDRRSGSLSLRTLSVAFPGPGFSNRVWSAVTPSNTGPFGFSTEYGFPFGVNVYNSNGGTPKTSTLIAFKSVVTSSATVPGAIKDDRFVTGFEFDVTVSEDLFYNDLLISVLSGSSDVYRLSVLDPNVGDEIITESITEEEFLRKENLGPDTEKYIGPIDSSNEQLLFGKFLTFLEGQQITIKVEFSDSIELEGYTVGGNWFPDLTTRYFDIDLIDIVALYPWIDGTNYVVGDWVYEGRKIYECNTAGVQTTDFATNSDKWDVLSGFVPHYGEMYQHDVMNIITINTINVFEIIDGFTIGTLKDFTFQNNQELVCNRFGTYKASFAVCFEDGNNQDWEISIFVNGVEQQNLTMCGTTKIQQEIEVSNSGFITLADNDIVTLRIANTTSTANPTIMFANVNLVRIEN